jgi:hypothetical protein
MSPAMITRYRLLAAWLVAAPAALSAQAAGLRAGGLTASFGEGVGSAALSCTACTSSRQLSVALAARVGVVVRPNLVLSVEGSGWTKDYANAGGSATAQIGFANAVLQWYPSAGSPFFIKAGGGLSMVKDEVTVSGVPNTTIESTGAAFVVGIGWDALLTSRVAITPYADFDMGASATAKINSLTSSQQLGGNLVHAGLALTWRR